MTEELTAARQRLVCQLSDDRLLTDGAWRDAFTAVRRETLLPRFYTVDGRIPVTDTDPDRARLLYTADLALPVTASVHRHGIAPTPQFCARLLHGMRLTPRDRFMVVGAADPYLTALLCHRLGDTHVVVAEADATLAERARTVLAAHGYHPRVHHGDIDTAPAPTGVICAYPQRRIPSAWLHTLEPNTVIVAALSEQLHSGPAVRLVVAAPGIAFGFFLPGPRPNLPPGPHREQPAERIGLTVTASTRWDQRAGHQLWSPQPGDEIATY